MAHRPRGRVLDARRLRVRDPRTQDGAAGSAVRLAADQREDLAPGVILSRVDGEGPVT